MHEQVTARLQELEGSASGRCEMCLSNLPVTRLVAEYPGGYRASFDVCRSCADRDKRRLQIERSRVTCYALLIVLIGAIAGAFIPGP